MLFYYKVDRYDGDLLQLGSLIYIFISPSYGSSKCDIFNRGAMWLDKLAETVKVRI